MRLRRLELTAIGLTLAFVCFLGGYFTGMRSAVNIVPVAVQDGSSEKLFPIQPQNPSAAAAADHGSSVVQTPEPAGPGPQSLGSGETAAPEVATRDSAGRININLASRSELMDLPGIGPVLAERIVEYRGQNGAFAQIEEIRKVSGIGEKRFDTIKDKITVG